LFADIVEEISETRWGKREKGGQPMPEENKAVVRREMEELFNHTGNLDAVEEIIAPDYVSHEPTSGETRGSLWAPKGPWRV
jgi:hypothetical protein